jgi:hypothetical protein
MSYFNVADSVSIIAQKRATRILVLTDPKDNKVPERAQTGFVRMLREAGGQADQFMVQAIDEHHHGVVAYARTAATGCIRGAETADIAQHLARQIEKRLAAKSSTTASAQPQPAATTGAPTTSSSSAMTAQPAVGR